MTKSMKRLLNPSELQSTVLIYSAIYAVLAAGLLVGAAFFDRSLVQAWDAFDQHYPNLIYMSRFYRQILDNLRQGQFVIPSYDLNLGDGQSILYTLYFYGVADPFNFPSVLFSQEHVIYYYSFLLLLRPYLAGLAFLYLCKEKGHAGVQLVAGAMMYLLSGFGLYAMSVHPFFMNAMIGLPLMVVGFDRIRQRKSPILFILTVWILALQGFYFTYMVSLMVVVYALVCVIRPVETEAHPVKAGFALFGRTVGYYMIGLGMAMCVFLPGVIGFLQSNRRDMANEYSLLSYSLDTLCYKLTNSIAIRYDDDVLAMPAIALAALLSILIRGSVTRTGKVHSSASKSKESRVERKLAILLILAFLAYFLPAPSFVFNGGNIYARHIFGLILVLSYGTVTVLPGLATGDDAPSKVQRIIFPILAGLLILQGFLYKAHTRWQMIGIVLWAAEAVALWIFLYHAAGRSVLQAKNQIKNQVKNQEKRSFGRPGMNAVLTWVTIACMLVNAVLVAPELLATLRKGNPLEEFSQSAPAQAGASLYAYNTSEDGFLGRVDADDRDCYFYNVGAALDLPTTRTYTSLLPAAQSQMWWELALTAGNNGYSVYGLDARTPLEALAGVSVYATGSDGSYRVPYGFAYEGMSPSGEKRIYRNTYPLSLGYVYTKVIDEATWQNADSVQKTDLMLQGVHLDEASETILVDHTELVDCEISCSEGASYEDGVLTITKPQATVTICFEGTPHAETYLRLSGVYTRDQMTGKVITESDEELHMHLISALDTHYFGREEYLYHLGFSEEPQQRVTIRFDTVGTVKLADLSIETLSMTDYETEIEALQQSQLQLQEVPDQGDVITGKIAVQESGYLTLSIPYMKGYTILVDGKKTAYQCANIWYVAVPITEGEHQIAVTYQNPGQMLGGILSVVSFAAFLIVVVLDIKRCRGQSAAICEVADAKQQSSK